MSFYSALTDTKIAEFTHNNMTPFFGGSIKQNMDEEMNNTLLEKYTGVDNTIRCKKNEQASFSDLKQNHYDHSPTANDIGRDRIEQSVFFNNVLPAEQIRVGVGSKESDSSKPSGGFQQDAFRDFDIYKNIDDLRVISNPKTTFESRTVDGIKEKLGGEVGEVRKNRVDRFYEKTEADLFKTTGAVTKSVKRPCVDLKNTSRVETTKEITGAPFINLGTKQVGDVRTTTKPQHGSYGVNRNKFTQINKGDTDDYGRKNILVYTNERDVTTTKTYEGNLSTYVKSMISPVLDKFRRTNKEMMIKSAREFGPMQTNVKKQTIYNPNSVAKPTLKETLIHDTHTGNMNAHKKNTIYDPNDVARTTIKETMIHDNHSGQIKTSSNKHIVYDPSEVARKTVRETLDNNDNTVNIKGNVKQTVYDPNNIAKTTIKETTVENDGIGNISGLETGDGYLSTHFSAPITNKQITSDNEYIGNPEYEGGDGYKTTNFKAKTTNKQITSDNEHVGIGSGMGEMMSYENIYNAVINQTKEITMAKPKPTQTGVKVSNGVEHITLTNMPVNTKNSGTNNIERVIQNTPVTNSEYTKNKEQYVHADRLSPDLLTVFNGNPYTHPLNTAV